MLQAALAEEEAEAGQGAVAPQSSYPASEALPDNTAEPSTVHSPQSSQVEGMEVHVGDHARSAGTASSTDESESSERHPASGDPSDSSDGSLDEDAMLARMVQAHMQVGGRSRRQCKPSEAGPSQIGEVEDSRTGSPNAPGQELLDTPADSSGSAATEAGLQETHAVAHESGVNASHSRGANADPDDHRSNNSSSDELNTAATKGIEPGVLKPAEQSELSAGLKNSLRKHDRKRMARRARQGAPDDGEHQQVCEVCSQVFQTRNLLFKHIKEQGHVTVCSGV